MAQIDSFVERLKREASIQDSEEFDDVLDLAPDIEDAIERHNNAYTSETLPEAEVSLVMLLAWAKVCLRRAAKFAQEPNSTGGQGFGSDRTTPYTKNINLAKMLEDRYRAQCDNMGLSTSATSVTLSRLIKKDDLINQITPRALGTPPGVRLSVSAGESLTTGTTIVLEWNTRYYNNFAEFLLFHMVDDVIYQKWNVDSAIGTPCINPSATRLLAISDVTRTAVRIENLDKTQENHFVLVNRSASDKYSYSNELTVGGV